MLFLLLKNKNWEKWAELLEVIQNYFFRKCTLPTENKIFTQAFVEKYFWDFIS